MTGLALTFVVCALGQSPAIRTVLMVLIFGLGGVSGYLLSRKRTKTRE